MKRTIVMMLAVSVAAVGFAADFLKDWDKSQRGQLAYQPEGKDVWRFYVHSTKPYFDLRVADGPLLTWARPADHVWHYGLWFSWKYINGVNYWEEKNGKADGETRDGGWSEGVGAEGRAFLLVNRSYRPQGAGKDANVLEEKRTIKISAPAEDGSYYMDWEMVFTAVVDVKFDRTPIPGEPNGQGWGGYAGLSMRFADGMKDVETVATGIGRVKRNEHNRLDTTAAAMGQSGIFADGKPYGVAILAHPSNPRAPGDWYALEGGNFNFFNAAFLLKGAYTLAKGETLTLRYRVHIHPGRWDAEKLKTCLDAYSQP